MDKNKQESIKACADFIQKEIDRVVDEKIITLSKSPYNKIDKKEIIKECELKQEKIFVDIFKDIFKECDDFFNLLQNDHSEIYERIMNFTKEKAVSQDISNVKIADLLELVPMKLAQQDIDILTNLGLGWFKKENWSNALLYFGYLTTVDGNNPFIWTIKGMSEHNLGKFTDASQSYTEALDIDPHYVLAHIQMMKCLIASNQKDLAQNYYENFLRTENSELYSSSGNFSSELDMIKNAVCDKAA